MLTRVRLATASALIAVLVTVLVSFGAVAGHDGRKLIDSRMIGIPANAASMFPGVTGGGIAWSIRRGHAELSSTGDLEISVRGLVLVATGANPIPTGRGLVSCNGGQTVVETASVPYSMAGNADVDAKVMLPQPCLGPIVFFAGDTPGGPRWFAVNGR